MEENKVVKKKGYLGSFFKCFIIMILISFLTFFIFTIVSISLQLNEVHNDILEHVILPIMQIGLPMICFVLSAPVSIIYAIVKHSK